MPSHLKAAALAAAVRRSFSEVDVVDARKHHHFNALMVGSCLGSLLGFLWISIWPMLHGNVGPPGALWSHMTDPWEFRIFTRIHEWLMFYGKCRAIYHTKNPIGKGLWLNILPRRWWTTKSQLKDGGFKRWWLQKWWCFVDAFTFGKNDFMFLICLVKWVEAAK